MRQKLLPWIVLAWIVVAAAHPEQEETSLRASWVSLETRDAVVELPREQPVLVLLLENPTAKHVVLRSRLRVTTDGRTGEFCLKDLALAPGEQRSIEVDALKGVKLERIRFSGKLNLSLEIYPSIKYLRRRYCRCPQRIRHHGSRRRHKRRQHGPRRLHGSHRNRYESMESIGVALPTLYFHPEQAGKLLVYREDVLRTRFDAGNFRNVDLMVPRRELEKNLTDVINQELRGTLVDSAVLSFIQATASFPVPDPNPPDILPAGSRKFCFGVDGSAYVDSGSDADILFGADPLFEDFGLEDAFVPAIRGWVAVGQNGNPVYSGFLDEYGCTPYRQVPSNDEMTVAFFPIYLRQTGANDFIRGFVSDLNLGPLWPDSMPYYLFPFEPAGAVTQVMLDNEEYVHTIFCAAASSIERFPGGLTNVLYEFRLREEGDNSGTNAGYAAEGHPTVRIKYSSAAQQKFTISHEYGHALLLGPLNPPLTANDIDYSVVQGEAEFQHTVTSKEWQLVAAFEGFAHFVSGIVWNEAVPDDGAIFTSGNQEFELDIFSRVFETNFNENVLPSQGVELDWAQFFWNYHTDVYVAHGGQVPKPSLSDIVQMWLESYPWPKDDVNQGGDFFNDFRDGVEAVVAGNSDKLERFDHIAEKAGIAY